MIEYAILERKTESLKIKKTKTGISACLMEILGLKVFIISTVCSSTVRLTTISLLQKNTSSQHQLKCISGVNGRSFCLHQHL